MEENIAYNRAIKEYKNGNYRYACDYYEQAFNADPENSLKNHDEIYTNWGKALFDLGGVLSDLAGGLGENKKLYESSFEKFKKAIELNPNYSEAYYNWGYALYDLASMEGNKTLYESSFEKFKKATELNPNYFDVYFWWGAALLGLARLENNIEKYKDNIQDLFLKAEKLKKGFGVYNLACLYSLLNEKGMAFDYLNAAFRLGNIPDRDYIKNDTDFDNLKSDPRFEELLNEYFPKDKS